MKFSIKNILAVNVLFLSISTLCKAQVNIPYNYKSELIQIGHTDTSSEKSIELRKSIIEFFKTLSQYDMYNVFWEMAYTIHNNYENLSKIKLSYNPKTCKIYHSTTNNDIIMFEFVDNKPPIFHTHSLIYGENTGYTSLFSQNLVLLKR